MNNIGLYIHIPFCNSKCPYCDFYSFRADDDTKNRYVSAVLRELRNNSKQFGCKADTLYIGGGTPSVLAPDYICQIINGAKSTFLTDDAEITVECNPFSLGDEFFEKVSECKVNRLSIGLQSANDGERRILGRRAGKSEVQSVVSRAKKAGINNISLDVMLGVPGQTKESLKSTLDFCISSGVPHLSCYILKIEENTPFFRMRNKLPFPSDDDTADMYLFMCEYLEEHGIMQYEISNFAVPGFESRHNLKYWHDEEYLGIGASAHSFLGGKRTYYPRDIEYFISGNERLTEGDGGDEEEFCMLALRLCEGLTQERFYARFHHGIPQKMLESAKQYEKYGLCSCENGGISLTRRGFLLSNSVISEIIL